MVLAHWAATLGCVTLMQPLTLATEIAQQRPIVLDLVVILASAAGMVMLLRFLRVAAIPAYLLTGVLIGPHTLGLIQSGENIESISGLATILLMFIVGLHLDPRGLGGGMLRTAAICVAGTVGAVLAMWPMLVLGKLGWPSALAVSMALVMSSTAVLLRLLQERRELHRVHGRLLFGSLIVQDMLALVALALLPLIAAWAGVRPTGASHSSAVLLPAAWPGWAQFVLAVVGIAAMIIACRAVLPKLLAEAARHTSSEVPLVLSAAVALGAALLAAGLGFSPELGAFLAGFVLAGTPFRHQLSGQLIPMRDLFMAVFFTAVGLRLDPSVIADGWVLIVVATLGLVLVKPLAMLVVAWVLGATAATSVFFGLAMFQAGEFAIVILSVSQGLGLIDAKTMSGLIFVVVLSLVVTPSVYELGHLLMPRFARLPTVGFKRHAPRAPMVTIVPVPHPAEDADAGAAAGGGAAAASEPIPPDPKRCIIIAGFGVVGRSIADRLEIQNIPFRIIDLNQQTVRTQRKLGRKAYYGDASNPQVLESAGIEEAEGVILTIPDDEATLRACRTIRALSPHVYIAARTTFLSKAMVATQLGADHVTVEEVATAEMMARQVLDQLGRRARAAAAAGGQAGAVKGAGTP